jgi:hypothetical protein
MKGKMFKYIFSILLLFVVLSGNSQTINGRLYTQFNNYYKWRGGAFDSVLLLPNLTGTAGLRGGALRYNGADSSLYVYTGTQWRKIDGGGSGSTPTLQQVTDQGNSTTDSINIIASSGERVGVFTKLTTGSTSGLLMLRNSFNPNIFTSYFPTYVLFNKDGYRTVLSYSNITKNNDVNIPDSSGTLPLRVKLNSTTYAPANNGTIDLGTISSDTATVVKAYVTNAESVTITKGQVVYIFGASGDRASVKLAKNTRDTFSSMTLGIVREDIAAGQAGWITTQGQVSGINLGAYSPGDILWLDSVAGGFTATKPQAPYHAVFLGVVERANVGNGLIYVKPQNGVELDELHDVRITSLSNNDVIRYNSSLGYWENKSVTTTLGYTPLNVTDTTAMLIPYLRKVDTLSLSNRIDAMQKGIQWQGVDTLMAYDKARNGFHDYSDFGGIISTTTILPNTSFVPGGGQAGASTAGWVSGVDYYQITTHTSATGNSHLINPKNYGLTSDWFVQNWRIQIPDLNDGTERYYLQIGFTSNLSAAIQYGLMFVYDLTGTMTGSAASTNWQILAANNNTRTWVTTSTAVAEDSWLNLRIIANNTAAYFYINGVQVGSTVTTNLPLTTNGATAILPIVRIVKTNGTTARTLWADYHTLDIKYNTPR